MSFFVKLSNFILEIIYPPKCGICGKINKNYICENCYRNLYKKYNAPHIHRYNNKYFAKHIYLFKYTGIIREKIIQYKFREKSYLKDFFVSLIIKNKKICCILKKYDIIMPIPMHNKRKRQRGYNQTELIAREIANYLKIEYCNKTLIKKVNSKPQRTLNRQERRKNVIGAYKINSSVDIKRKRIILFDDVYTTGSTANECSKVLKKAGAYKVDILTIAKD